MRRALIITFALGFIVAAMFGGMAAAYGLGGVVEGLFTGASRFTNLLVLVLVFVMVTASVLTIAERKWSAMMQDRIGPNRARLALPLIRDRSLGGLPHLVADSLKMVFKEDFIPKRAHRFFFNLAPILSFAPVLALFAIVPAGPDARVLGHQVQMVVASPDFGLLFVFAIASLAVYGTALAGWSSNNKLALLGGVRASSQMISYEVGLGLSLVGMMLVFSTVQLSGPSGMVEAQAQYLWSMPDKDLGIPRWGLFLQPLGLVLFFAAAFAETKRTPFDLPEGESEIIGYFVEYSGLKFGMFMISEFVEIVVLSGLIAAIFLGGHHLPFGEQWLSAQPLFRENPWLFGAVLGTVFWVKVLFLCWLQLAVRWTFPRFRYDQVQALGWKVLLPMGLLNVFATGALVLWDPSLKSLFVLGALQIAVLLALTFSGRRAALAASPH
ncbi:MAG: NADH-quinone oxidoreductase subunit H [Myxococcales bacterium]|nr:NADH-quinone oxidoreductase subunit H [Myxococcales bacterium]